nr:MAG TPA: hypothetical protein [Caudoviricetes sp.]
MFIDIRTIIEIGIAIIACGIGFLARECIQIPINNRLWYIRRRLDIYIDMLIRQNEIRKQNGDKENKFYSIDIDNMSDITTRLTLELNNFYGVKL